MTDALVEAHRRAAPDSPLDLGLLKASALDPSLPLFGRIADGIRQTGSFNEPEQWHFAAERACTREEWLDQFPTLGALTRLPPDRLTEVLDRVGAVIDRLGGHIVVPYATMAVTSTRSTTA
ncbi:hypothetical protein ACIPJS_05695 [Streptomyces sp. NPDC086783]|uniref:hypothetical protein n=1 Tax=Streptomyces sp. NPDC086783 TaxID=3365758 RepID=UPI0038055E20